MPSRFPASHMFQSTYGKRGEPATGASIAAILGLCLGFNILYKNVENCFKID